MDCFVNFVSFFSNVMTIIASGLVIFLFFKNKSKIKSAFNFLLSYSFHLTLSELKNKIERLNDYNVNSDEGKRAIIEILHEIQGQIQGNEKLRMLMDKQFIKIKEFNDFPFNLSEPKKRSLVSELRESLRNLELDRFKDFNQE
ncbi:hypothetical protein [Aquiflexum sp.]|uniref:hypothetical protein n=1 Tax=Aquiflexum sp. TaxID=1872584 RepID=UPI0035934EA8